MFAGVILVKKCFLAYMQSQNPYGLMSLKAKVNTLCYTGSLKHCPALKTKTA